MHEERVNEMYAILDVMKINLSNIRNIVHANIRYINKVETELQSIQTELAQEQLK